MQTNIVCFDIFGLGMAAGAFVAKLKEQGALALAMGEYKVRLVMHRGIEREHVEKAATAIEATAKLRVKN